MGSWKTILVSSTLKNMSDFLMNEIHAAACFLDHFLFWWYNRCSIVNTMGFGKTILVSSTLNFVLRARSFQGSYILLAYRLPDNWGKSCSTYFFLNYMLLHVFLDDFYFDDMIVDTINPRESFVISFSKFMILHTFSRDLYYWRVMLGSKWCKMFFSFPCYTTATFFSRTIFWRHNSRHNGPRDNVADLVVSQPYEYASLLRLGIHSNRYI